MNNNCYSGINIPTPIADPCNGEVKSTLCVATPTAFPDLDIAEGDTQDKINTAIKDAILYKEEQIQTLTEDTQAFVDRKIFRGTFLMDTLDNGVENSIPDLAIDNIGTGIYKLTSELFTISTSVLVTPNGIPSGYDDVTVSYDYSNANAGEIIFKIKNNGVLVDLPISPIKIEI